MAFCVLRAFSEKPSGAFLFSDPGITLLGATFHVERKSRQSPRMLNLECPLDSPTRATLGSGDEAFYISVFPEHGRWNCPLTLIK